MGRELHIVSLGGSGGFGMNASLLHAGGEGVLVDFGIGFPAGVPAGISRLVPNADPLAEICPNLHGIVLTHAHDDHVAALPWLPGPWREAPIFALPFPLAAARDRFDGVPAPAGRFRPLEWNRPVDLGPFRVRAVRVTHSVPQSAMIVVDTPAGTIVHTGDFKLDRDPWDGALTDEASLRELGRRGVRALLLDSTGALREARAETERSVWPVLSRAIAEAEGQVVVSTFSSQVHRIDQALRAARAAGRRAALLGMRMQRMVRLAVDLRLLRLPAGLLLPPDELAELPPARRLWLAGGCQGESQSSLSRLSWDSDSRASVGAGDTVIVSASVIPGSEVQVSRMLDRFLRLGARVLHVGTEPGLHASGHGSREEILELLDWLRPEVVLPVHGDRVHLEAAAELAAAADPAPREVVVAERGETVVLGPDGVRPGETFELLPWHHDDLGAVDFEVVRERRHLSEAGAAFVRIRASGEGMLEDLRVEAVGIPGPPLGDREELVRDRVAALLRLAARNGFPPRVLEEEIAREVAAALRRGRQRRPRVVVVLDAACGPEDRP